MKYRRLFCLTATALILGLCGCLNLGPDYQRPDLGIETPSAYEFTPDDTRSLIVEDRWWEIFGDRELNQYVKEALANNWDIKQAAARVLEARAQYVRARADRFPAVGVSGLRDRRQITGGAAADGIIVDSYELTAPASFELDLWSKLKKASQAAWSI